MSSAKETTCSAFLDSVHSYLDSVPDLREQLFSQLPYWKASSQKIEIAEDEYEEFQIHLEYSFLHRFTETERLSNAKQLINYKLSEEVKQFDYAPYSRDSLHAIFQTITNYDTYSDSVVIMDKFWANSERCIVVIGQTHSATGSEHEKEYVTQVQNEIFHLYKTLYNNGIDLSIEEGFYMREIDKRIPTKSPRSKIIQSIEKKITFQFDSLYDVLVYGFEDKELYRRADSALKTPYFLLHYLGVDSISFPCSRADFISNFRGYIYSNLKSLPENYSKSLDTALMFSHVHEYSLGFDTIDIPTVISLTNKMLCSANDITLNERNRYAVMATKKAFDYTNRNIAMMKIGDAHLNRNGAGITKVGYNDKLKTIQDFCREEQISYVYIITKTQNMPYFDF